jgi:hypothetical protein
MIPLRPMPLPADPTGSGPVPPVPCDMCGAPMRLALIVPHPEKAGQLHVYECTGCELPMVKYVPGAD